MLLVDGRYCMEKLLVDEVEAWEAQLWNTSNEFLDKLCRGRRDQALEKDRLIKEWRACCRKGLEANIRAMETRMDAAKIHVKDRGNWQHVHDRIRRAWQSVIQRFVDTSVSTPSSSTLSSRLENLKNDLDRLRRKKHLTLCSIYKHDEVQRYQYWRRSWQMGKQLEKELEDIEFRLDKGLEHCDQFWSDPELVECRHSQSKWFFMTVYQLSSAPPPSMPTPMR
jgi:hypothetical protein